MIELGYHHFATPHEIMALENEDQWLLKSLGEKMMCNKWVRSACQETKPTPFLPPHPQPKSQQASTSSLQNI